MLKKCSDLIFLKFFLSRTGHSLLHVPKVFCASYLVTQSCLTLCDPMNCSSPAFSVHEILQARILENSFISPEDLPDPGTEPRSLALSWILYYLSHQGSPEVFYTTSFIQYLCLYWDYLSFLLDNWRNKAPFLFVPWHFDNFNLCVLLPPN